MEVVSETCSPLCFIVNNQCTLTLLETDLPNSRFLTVEQFELDDINQLLKQHAHQRIIFWQSSLNNKEFRQL
jgi:hypothetical protein